MLRHWKKGWIVCVVALFLFHSRGHCFEKVVIWGHKLHSHTHSYIHNAFYRAFLHLGYPTYWFDHTDDVSGFDFSHTLFLTEGQSDAQIPIRNDCQYILHNTPDSKYLAIDEKNRLALQVFTKGMLTRPGCRKIDPCIYFDLAERTLYIPWATDLLPHEIDASKRDAELDFNDGNVYWVGTIAGGEFGNIGQLAPFITACCEQGIDFIHQGLYSSDRQKIGRYEDWEQTLLVCDDELAPIIAAIEAQGLDPKEYDLFPRREEFSFVPAWQEEGIDLIYYGSYCSAPKPVGVHESQERIAFSYMAPAIVGHWQEEQGYIPCRIFKNISYGKWGVTNSEMVWELFDKKIVYNSDTYQLFYDAEQRMETLTLGELHELMDFVKVKHTYLNRIELILWAFEQIQGRNNPL